ncbi:hypothetical protein CAPTEDRAFT_209480 [Capitella teleta]|uniref:Uncharacterized protein n=1 Tax=Capitella teleta TaxID=283909 RepID=R7UG95_CAPTE|nr:hypothetical protein CAPTEDRAFT_209480 [Capitella teleta]|eukprot:ELU02317.1 hypothetical protein CAPTEDRAFT_209480 [Capitella teleta]
MESKPAHKSKKKSSSAKSQPAAGHKASVRRFSEPVVCAPHELHTKPKQTISLLAQRVLTNNPLGIPQRRHTIANGQVFDLKSKKKAARREKVMLEKVEEKVKEKKEGEGEEGEGEESGEEDVFDHFMMKYGIIIDSESDD